MNRKMLAVLIGTAFLSMAAGEGTSPWRNHRVYGWEIMSKTERAMFRAEMNSYKEYDEQLAFWREHVALMKKRAWDKGLLLDEPPEIVPASSPAYRRAIFAQYLMTGEEIEAYRAKERTLRNDEEREAFLREHEVAMKQKAWERGLPIGPTREERRRENEAKSKARDTAGRNADSK